MVHRLPTFPFLFWSDDRMVADPDDWTVRLRNELTTRDELLRELVAGLELPEYFGSNWDALDECLRDLHWLTAKRIVVIHEVMPQLPEESLRAYLEILERAIRHWRRNEDHDLVVIFPSGTETQVRRLLGPAGRR